MNNPTPTEFYRYEATVYAEIDAWGDVVSPLYRSPNLTLRTYNLHKETPCGYWIGYGHLNGYVKGKSRWIPKSSRKRYAYPTKEEALINYIKRTEKRINLLGSKVRECEIGVDQAKHMLTSIRENKIKS